MNENHLHILSVRPTPQHPIKVDSSQFLHVLFIYLYSFSTSNLGTVLLVVQINHLPTIPHAHSLHNI